jgi:hypothetical protein
VALESEVVRQQSIDATESRACDICTLMGRTVRVFCSQCDEFAPNLSRAIFLLFFSKDKAFFLECPYNVAFACCNHTGDNGLRGRTLDDTATLALRQEEFR